MKVSIMLALLMLGVVPVSDKPPTKSFLNAKIYDLSTSPTPKRLRAGVSEPISPIPEKINYHCPVCEEQTIHVRPKGVYRHSMWTLCNLEFMRKNLNEVSKKSKLPMSFDETCYCKVCSEDNLTDDVYIEIEVEGVRVRNKYENNDLRILNAFFSNRKDVNIQMGSGFRAYPLKNYIPRIQILLGLRSAPTSEEN